VLIEGSITPAPDINSKRARPGEQHIAIPDHIVFWN
jgi:hypothetical protein